MGGAISSTLIYLAIVLGTLAALMLGVRSLQSRDRIDPETARKLVHVGMGVICFPLSSWFTTLGPVLVLAIPTVAILLFVRYHGGANQRFGSVLGATGRASFGEFYYPLGVLVTLLVCGADRAAYCCAIGVLTFGDMAGAIVGKRCGWLAYSIGGNHKSVEGSLAVFVVSFAWIAGTILALTDIRGADVAAGSLSVALAAVVLEAVSRRGLDNLLLPVGVAALVLAWHKPAMPIATRHALEFTGAILAFTSAFAAAIAIVRVRARSPFRATE